MKLATEFVRLPLRFDSDRLAEEVLAFSEADWKPHPQGHAGNSALSLVAAHGDPRSDEARGPMLETPLLARAPYLRQVLASLQAPIGRTRLMRLDGNAEATAHADIHYYWAERLRVHVPVLTTPGVRFVCGAHELHMAPGQCWVFDTWKVHNVLNPDDTRRIHLVADTVGSSELWDLVEQGAWPFADPPRPGAPERFVPYRAEASVVLAPELSNVPLVMTPWELREHARAILDEAAAVVGDDPTLRADVSSLAATCEDFVRRWRALWARFGAASEGGASYRDAVGELDRALGRHAGRLRLANRLDPTEILRHRIVRAALNPDLAPAAGEPSRASSSSAGSASSPPKMVPQPASNTPLQTASAASAARRSRFDRPIFIVSPPRSGSSLLFETLARSPSVWTIGGESHGVIEGIRPLHPRARGWESNRLDASAAHSEIVERLEDAWFLRLVDRDGKRPAAGERGLRFLEKTPKNALRVPFLAAAFPDARFVYLYRHPRESIHSTWEAWQSRRFVTYPDLPGWEGPPWSLLLTPGWRELAGRDGFEIAARQWAAATEALLDDLGALPPERWCVANYGRLVVEPMREIARLCDFLGLEWDRALEAPLPVSRHTLSPPEPGKWKRHADRIASVEPWFAEVGRRAQQLFAREPQHLSLGEASAGDPSDAPVVAPPAAAATPPAVAASTAVARRPSQSKLRSVFTGGLPELFEKLGGTLLVTTYQSGFLVAVRADGASLNTHFRTYPSPMGLAVRRDRIAVGTAQSVVELVDVPAAASRVEPVGRHDACFVPRREQVTGDVRVHEMAYVGDEIWLVATRFSCLAKIAPGLSFVPTWRPPFVSALAPDDRCHLNGMAIEAGKPRYVTALGCTDTPAGWRESKGTAGVLLEVPSGEIVAGGLSMPHSPRVHGGRIWVLESGKGELGVVDAATGRVDTVARFPGFTRGLAFAGPFAFVGLSQVRESVFAGLPLTEQVRERVCGVWVVDLRSGRTVGFLRFEDQVQEIFDVQWLAGSRFPELAEAGGELAATTFVLPEDAMAAVAAGRAG